MYWGSLQEDQIWKQIIQNFQKANPSLKVSPQYVNKNYNQKLVVTTSAGTAADVINMQSKYISSFFKAFQPLDDLIKASKTTNKEEFFPMDWERGAWQGKQYGVPWDSATSQIFYNEDVFKAAGVDLPPSTWDDSKWTWDAFLAAAKKLTSGSGPNATWGFQPQGWWVYLQPWIWANGGVGVVDKWNNPTKSTLGDPAVKDAIGWIVDLRTKWHVAPLPGQMTMNLQTALSTNRLGMWEANTSSVPALLADKNLKWNVAPYPRGKSGAFVRDPVDQTCLSKATKQADAGFKLVEYITSEDGEKLITTLGRGIPSRVKVAESDVFLRPSSSVHWKVFYDAAKSHVKQQPLTPVFDWMDRTIGQEYTSLIAGHLSLDDFANKLVPQINQKLEQAAKGSG